MTTKYGHAQEFMALLEQLYNCEAYENNMNVIKNRMKEIHPRCSPQYDDIEAEITCLLIMHNKPKLIYEFSPCCGWSTMYMLNTLDVMNNNSCLLHSFDIHNACERLIRGYPNLKEKWVFHLGDVVEEYGNFTTDIDYLFIDSDHSEKFAQIYVTRLLEPLLTKLKETGKKILISVHDVFHTENPSAEGVVVVDFLKKNNIEYFSPINEEHFKKIKEIRSKLNFDKKTIHYSTTNPCIFFMLG